MENKNSTTIETEPLEAVEHKDEVKPVEGQQDGKALSRGQKKKLKKKNQKEKADDEDLWEVDNLASELNNVQINNTNKPSKAEEQKSENKESVTTIINNNVQANKTEDNSNEEAESDLTPEERFKCELAWCVKQIKLGLENNKVNRDQRNIIPPNSDSIVKESMDVLKVLQNPDAPLIKKRHLMKVIFGDYRSLMKTIK